jgi:hypothetical protein
MTTHDFGTTLPLGICSTCLARMVDPKVGMPARTLALPDGWMIFAVYCEHNVAGAWRGRAGLWKCVQPKLADELADGLATPRGRAGFAETIVVPFERLAA